MNEDNPKENGWTEYKRMLMSDRETNQKNFKQLFEKIDTIRVEIATLKVKAGVWGLIGGIIPIVIMACIYLLMEVK